MSETPKTGARDALLADLRAQLERAESIGRRRRLRTYDGVDFSSNDYLGLSARPSLEIATPWTGSTGSRSLSGHREAWDQLERELADWYTLQENTPRAALFFPSGYSANEGLLSSVIGPKDLVVSDAWNHGSLIDGIRLSRARKVIVPHQDLAAIEHALASDPSPGGRRFVVSESVFGMDGDRSDIEALAGVCRRHDALLILDEAHATGVFGVEGRGLASATPGIDDVLFATVHTCGKALGAHGAYVIGAAELREYLIQSCRHFIFTTALPEAFASLARSRISQARAAAPERERLWNLRKSLAAGLSETGLVPDRAIGDSGSQILPILLGSDETALAWSEQLQSLGLRVPAIRYPTVPKGQARLRISLRADHREEDLARLAEAIRSLHRTS